MVKFIINFSKYGEGLFDLKLNDLIIGNGKFLNNKIDLNFFILKEKTFRNKNMEQGEKLINSEVRIAIKKLKIKKYILILDNYKLLWGVKPKKIHDTKVFKEFDPRNQTKYFDGYKFTLKDVRS